MEEYLQYMKTLRSQINDVEDQAAKISVEEQMQITTIKTMEKDLDSAKSETEQLKEDAEKMMKEKGQICSLILEKQRKIASLECDSSALNQTLKLIQQERISLSAILVEKSNFYAKVTKDISAKLQQQKDWVDSQRTREMEDGKLVKDEVDEKIAEDEGMSDMDNDLYKENTGTETRKNLMVKLDAARAKLDGIVGLKSQVALENDEIKQSLEQVKSRLSSFKPELLALDIKTLEDECQALESDKAGETEYLQSLQDQIDKLKGISHVIKCACGQEYKVAAACT